MIFILGSPRASHLVFSFSPSRDLSTTLYPFLSPTPTALSPTTHSLFHSQYLPLHGDCCVLCIYHVRGCSMYICVYAAVYVCISVLDNSWCSLSLGDQLLVGFLSLRMEYICMYIYICIRGCALCNLSLSATQCHSFSPLSVLSHHLCALSASLSVGDHRVCVCVCVDIYVYIYVAVCIQDGH